jgi:hypothetical protein
MDRPEPPASPDSSGALVAKVQDNPDAWLLYLRNSHQYMQSLENSLNAARAAEQGLQTSVAERDGIIRYQKEQLAADQRQITELELEKRHLVAAASPAVQAPQETAALFPQAVAEARADDPARPPALATPPYSRTASLSEKIPDPKEFDGTRSDLRRFTQQIYGKMNANADRFPLATNRMTYVAGRLTGSAYALMLPKIRYGIPQFVDYPQMLEYLEQAFGDPDRAQNAQNKLFQLRQKNLDFSTYFSEFQRLALEGDMPESALTPLLFQGISRELQDMLLHNPPPSQEFSAYTSHLQKLDNRYRQHQQQVFRNRSIPPAKTTPASYAAAARPAAHPDAPARRPYPPQPALPSRPSTHEPMDLSSQRNSTPSGRKERGECFRCGSKAHRVAHCPEPDTRLSTQPRPANGSRSPSPPTTYRALRAASPQLYHPASPPRSPPPRLAASPPYETYRPLNGVSLN